jgi:hypothetical protein
LSGGRRIGDNSGEQRIVVKQLAIRPTPLPVTPRPVRFNRRLNSFKRGEIMKVKTTVKAGTLVWGD